MMEMEKLIDLCKKKELKDKIDLNEKRELDLESLYEKD